MDNDFDIFNNIKIDLDEYTEASLNDIEARRLRNRISTRLDTKRKELDRKVNKPARKHSTATAAVAALLIFTVIFYKPVMAAIRGVGLSIESFLNRDSYSLNRYTTKVLESVTDKGITMSLHDVLLDDGQLVATLRIDCKNADRQELGIADSMVPYKISIFLDGELLNIGYNMSPQYNDVYSSDILLHEELPNVDLNKSHNIRFVCDTLMSGVGAGNNISGNWAIDFQADGKAMSSAIKVIPLNTELKVKDGTNNVTWSIKELRISPYSIKVNYTIEQQYLGPYTLKLYDEKGNELQDGGGFSNQNGDSRSQYILKKNIKKVKIVPHAVKDHKDVFFNDKAIEIAIPSN